jgi:hypothetical protein
MEKVDVVKRLVRSHNYKEIERVYARCRELGIFVNKNALHRFSEKLEHIDKVKRHSSSTLQIIDESTFSDPIMTTASKPQAKTEHTLDVVETELLSDSTVIEKPAGRMSPADAKKREAEITFELGALKIREHALLEELNELANIFDASH